ncbi:hypothetical protein BH10CYA1_BH10CYA1_18390 [soil metagenome]
MTENTRLDRAQNDELKKIHDLEKSGQSVQAFEEYKSFMNSPEGKKLFQNNLAKTAFTNELLSNGDLPKLIIAANDFNVQVKDLTSDKLSEIVRNGAADPASALLAEAFLVRFDSVEALTKTDHSDVLTNWAASSISENGNGGKDITNASGQKFETINADGSSDQFDPLTGRKISHTSDSGVVQVFDPNDSNKVVEMRTPDGTKYQFWQSGFDYGWDVYPADGGQKQSCWWGSNIVGQIEVDLANDGYGATVRDKVDSNGNIIETKSRDDLTKTFTNGELTGLQYKDQQYLRHDDGTWTTADGTRQVVFGYDSSGVPFIIDGTKVTGFGQDYQNSDGSINSNPDPYKVSQYNVGDEGKGSEDETDLDYMWNKDHPEFRATGKFMYDTASGALKEMDLVPYGNKDATPIKVQIGPDGKPTGADLPDGSHITLEQPPSVPPVFDLVTKGGVVEKFNGNLGVDEFGHLTIGDTKILQVASGGFDICTPDKVIVFEGTDGVYQKQEEVIVDHWNGPKDDPANAVPKVDVKYDLNGNITELSVLNPGKPPEQGAHHESWVPNGSGMFNHVVDGEITGVVKSVSFDANTQSVTITYDAPAGATPATDVYDANGWPKHTDGQGAVTTQQPDTPNITIQQSPDYSAVTYDTNTNQSNDIVLFPGQANSPEWRLDNSGEWHYKDGLGNDAPGPANSKIEIQKDGSVTFTLPGGETVTYNKDGVVTEEHSSSLNLKLDTSKVGPPFTYIAVDLNGQPIKDGNNIREYTGTASCGPDGSFRLAQGDGPSLVVNAKGNLETHNSDGSWDELKPGGAHDLHRAGFVLTYDRSGHLRSSEIDASMADSKPNITNFNAVLDPKEQGAIVAFLANDSNVRDRIQTLDGQISFAAVQQLVQLANDGKIILTNDEQKYLTELQNGFSQFSDGQYMFRLSDQTARITSDGYVPLKEPLAQTEREFALALIAGLGKHSELVGEITTDGNQLDKAKLDAAILKYGSAGPNYDSDLVKTLQKLRQSIGTLGADATLNALAANAIQPGTSGAWQALKESYTDSYPVANDDATVIQKVLSGSDNPQTIEVDYKNPDGTKLIVNYDTDTVHSHMTAIHEPNGAEITNMVMHPDGTYSFDITEGQNHRYVDNVMITLNNGTDDNPGQLKFDFGNGHTEMLLPNGDRQVTEGGTTKTYKRDVNGAEHLSETVFPNGKVADYDFSTGDLLRVTMPAPSHWVLTRKDSRSDWEIHTISGANPPVIGPLVSTLGSDSISVGDSGQVTLSGSDVPGGHVDIVSGRGDVLTIPTPEGKLAILNPDGSFELTKDADGAVIKYYPSGLVQEIDYKNPPGFKREIQYNDPTDPMSAVKEIDEVSPNGNKTAMTIPVGADVSVTTDSIKITTYSDADKEHIDKTVVITTDGNRQITDGTSNTIVYEDAAGHETKIVYGTDISAVPPPPSREFEYDKSTGLLNKITDIDGSIWLPDPNDSKQWLHYLDDGHPPERKPDPIMAPGSSPLTQEHRGVPEVKDGVLKFNNADRSFDQFNKDRSEELHKTDGSVVHIDMYGHVKEIDYNINGNTERRTFDWQPDGYDAKIHKITEPDGTMWIQDDDRDPTHWHHFQVDGKTPANDSNGKSDDHFTPMVDKQGIFEKEYPNGAIDIVDTSTDRAVTSNPPEVGDPNFVFATDKGVGASNFANYETMAWINNHQLWLRGYEVTGPNGRTDELNLTKVRQDEQALTARKNQYGLSADDQKKLDALHAIIEYANTFDAGSPVMACAMLKQNLATDSNDSAVHVLKAGETIASIALDYEMHKAYQDYLRSQSPTSGAPMLEADFDAKFKSDAKFKTSVAPDFEKNVAARIHDIQDSNPGNLANAAVGQVLFLDSSVDKGTTMPMELSPSGLLARSVQQVQDAGADALGVKHFVNAQTKQEYYQLADGITLAVSADGAKAAAFDRHGNFLGEISNPSEIKNGIAANNLNLTLTPADGSQITNIVVKAGEIDVSFADGSAEVDYHGEKVHYSKDNASKSGADRIADFIKLDNGVSVYPSPDGSGKAIVDDGRGNKVELPSMPILAADGTFSAATADGRLVSLDAHGNIKETLTDGSVETRFAGGMTEIDASLVPPPGIRKVEIFAANGITFTNLDGVWTMTGPNSQNPLKVIPSGISDDGGFTFTLQDDPQVAGFKADTTFNINSDGSLTMSNTSPISLRTVAEVNLRLRGDSTPRLSVQALNAEYQRLLTLNGGKGVVNTDVVLDPGFTAGGDQSVLAA